MIRESTDKEGGREDVGRGERGEGRGMKHDVAKSSGKGGGFIKAPKFDHEAGKSTFDGVGGRKSSRREY